MNEQRQELSTDKLHRALVRMTNGRIDRATGDQLAQAVHEAGLGDAPPSIVEEALDFVVKTWRRRCYEEMTIALAMWTPTDAERERPH